MKARLTYIPVEVADQFGDFIIHRDEQVLDAIKARVRDFSTLSLLITSIMAIRKGHHDIGIGTIIGSNIYNVLMIIGVGAAIGGIVVVPQVFTDYAVMIGFSLALLIVIKTGLITRPMGIGLTAGYIAYLAWLFFLQ